MSVSNLLLTIAVVSYALEIGIVLIVFIITRPVGIQSENDSPLLGAMLVVEASPYRCAHTSLHHRPSVASLGTDILTIPYCPRSAIRTTRLHSERKSTPAVFRSVRLARESFNTSGAAQMHSSVNGIDPWLCQSTEILRYDVGSAKLALSKSPH